MALQNATFEEILDDLSSRFIINVPEEELASVERICFQIEQAHWFYEDFIREQRSDLPSFLLKNFTAKFFQHCPLLAQWSDEHESAFRTFMEYKVRVPVCGAIMMNEELDKCVLVKGWSSRSGWGFPKGKINKDEPDSQCAVREVYEETGYDISPLLQEENSIEMTMREQRIRLYIIRGVSETTVFEPQTRKEISRIEWARVSELPTWKPVKYNGNGVGGGGYKSDPEGRNRSVGNFNASRQNASRFYMVVPFVGPLKRWVQNQKKNKQRKLDQVPMHRERIGNEDPISSTQSGRDRSEHLKAMLGIGKNSEVTSETPLPALVPAVQQLFTQAQTQPQIPQQQKSFNIPDFQQMQPTGSSSHSSHLNSSMSPLTTTSLDNNDVRKNALLGLLQGTNQSQSSQPVTVQQSLLSLPPQLEPSQAKSNSLLNILHGQPSSGPASSQKQFEPAFGQTNHQQPIPIPQIPLPQLTSVPTSQIPQQETVHERLRKQSLLQLLSAAGNPHAAYPGASGPILSVPPSPALSATGISSPNMMRRSSTPAVERSRKISSGPVRSIRDHNLHPRDQIFPPRRGTPTSGEKLLNNLLNSRPAQPNPAFGHTGSSLSPQEGSDSIELLKLLSIQDGKPSVTSLTSPSPAATSVSDANASVSTADQQQNASSKQAANTRVVFKFDVDQIVNVLG